MSFFQVDSRNYTGTAPRRGSEARWQASMLDRREARSDHHWSWWELLAGNAVLAGVYFAAGRLGLLLPIVHDHVTLLWAPTGIALAALLLFGPGAAPGVALGAFLVNFTVGGPLVAAAGISLGNTLEAAGGAWMLRRAGFHPSLDRVRDVFLLLGLGAAASPLVSAAIGVSSLAAFGLLPAGREALNV